MAVILVIEDHQWIRENTCELLELKGHEVIMSANGKAGLTLLKEKKPDLVLCDIHVPELNGYEVLIELKSDIEVSHTPLILLSAMVEKTEIEFGLSMGAKAYLTKPFEPEELYELIASCLMECGEG